MSLGFSLKIIILPAFCIHEANTVMVQKLPMDLLDHISVFQFTHFCQLTPHAMAPMM